MCRPKRLRLPALGGNREIVEHIVGGAQLAARLGEEHPEGSGECMKVLISLLAAVFLFLALAAVASAEGQKKISTKEERLEGTVHMVDKETATIIIRKGAVQGKVVYNAETKFTIQNKSGGSIDDVIVGRRAICLGTFNEKAQLAATRVDVRTK